MAEKNEKPTKQNAPQIHCTSAESSGLTQGLKPLPPKEKTKLATKTHSG
jgi:hypothetical protein